MDGFIGTQDLASLESKLREFHSDTFDYPVVIDSSPAALCFEVVAVCDAARKDGFQRIRFAVGTEER